MPLTEMNIDAFTDLSSSKIKKIELNDKMQIQLFLFPVIPGSRQAINNRRKALSSFFQLDFSNS